MQISEIIARGEVECDFFPSSYFFAEGKKVKEMV